MKILIVVLCAATALAQSWQPPSDKERCPSQWGAGDQRGSANWMKPETVLRASKLIQKGEVFELGHVLSPSMPLSNNRTFGLHTKRTVLNAGTNRRGSNEEFVVTELGQVGTQFDGFAHQTIGASLYNCFALDEVSTRTGFSKLGIENVGTLMTRGVLIDVAGYKGVETLAVDYEITTADLQGALKRQGVTLTKGDAVLIHTGWGKYWGKDNAKYGAASPGIGAEAAQWLAQQGPMLVGADNQSIDVSPNPDKRLNLPVHQIMLVVNGIHLLENLNLTALAAQKVYEAAFIVQPLKMQGGTGSTVAPVAIR